jgi:hypothetical protein
MTKNDEIRSPRRPEMLINVAIKSPGADPRRKTYRKATIPMSELFEFTPGFSKYAGMTTDEMERAIAEDERQAIEADPRTVAARRAAERREAERRAEQERRADEARQQQQAAAAAELE